MSLIRSIAVASAVTFASIVPATAADKLTVLLEWFVNPDHAPMVVAEELGLFGDADLDVELLPPSDPSSVPRLVAAGQADVGVHYQPNLYLDVHAGLPIVRIGTLVETPLNSLIVLADGEIDDLSALAGKKIGYSVSGFEDALVDAMLSSVGLAKEDVELINVNFSLSPALISGQVDATIGGFRNFELTQMRLEGRPGTAFYPEEHGVPAYDELIFITRKDSVDDARLPRFLGAVESASIYITNHPEEAWTLFIHAYPDLDNALNRQAFIDTLPRLAKRPRALDVRRYQRFADFMAEQGLIDSALPVGDYAVALP